MHAGTGTEIDDVIGMLDRIFVVFDDDDGVAEIAQAIERQQQALVVALMQADRWLVEDVHDADEARSDLAGESDALRFAARQRFGAAIERQIVEPDVAEEPQPIAGFLDDLECDLAAPAFELQFAAKRSASHTAMLVMSGRSCSATNTLRAARLSRDPPQSGHG